MADNPSNLGEEEPADAEVSSAALAEVPSQTTAPHAGAAAQAEAAVQLAAAPLGVAAPVGAKKPKQRRDPAQRKARRQSLREDAVNLPNLLTFGRIAIIPVVLWLLDRGTPQDCAMAALVYAAAAITDLLDGYLARKMNVVSVLGKFLDPLADKLLVMATLIWMVPMGRISEWVVILLLAREISITGLRSIASSEGVVIAAGGGGKSKTALQMVGILCLVIGYPYHLNLGFLDLGVVDLVPVGRWLIYISLFFSFGSAFQYVGLFAEAAEAKERRHAPR